MTKSSNHYRRISIFAGPGVGKSVLAARLFVDLKIQGKSIELVPEHVKTWVYQERKPKSYQQVELFSKQLIAEDTFLTNSDLIVTDSPLWLSYIYGKHQNLSGTEHLPPLCEEFDDRFPSLNIALTSKDDDYQTMGRFESAKEASLMQEKILKFCENRFPIRTFDRNDYDEIFHYVNQELN